MKNLLLLCLIVLVGSPNVVAQERPAKDRLDLFVSSQLYLNKLNVKNDERYPSKITARNTLGLYLGATYTRFVKKHWMFSGELGYGQAFHDVTFAVPTNIYDSAVANAFGPSFSVSSLTTIRYAQISLWVGYQHDLKNHWHIEGRLGCAGRIRIGGEWESKTVTAIVSDPNGAILNQTLFAYVNSLTEDSYRRQINWGNQTGELYLGCRRDISSFFANSVQIGIVCSRIVLTKDPPNIYVNTYASGSALPVSQDRYEDLNTAIGIRIGASLW